MAFWLIALARISCASFPALKSAFSLSLIDPQVGQFPAPLPFSFRDTSRNLTLPSNRGSVQGAGDASGWPVHIDSVPILGSPLPPDPAQAPLIDGPGTALPRRHQEVEKRPSVYQARGSWRRCGWVGSSRTGFQDHISFYPSMCWSHSHRLGSANSACLSPIPCLLTS